MSGRGLAVICTRGWGPVSSARVLACSAISDERAYAQRPCNRAEWGWSCQRTTRVGLDLVKHKMGGTDIQNKRGIFAGFGKRRIMQKPAKLSTRVGTCHLRGDRPLSFHGLLAERYNCRVSKKLKYKRYGLLLLIRMILHVVY